MINKITCLALILGASFMTALNLSAFDISFVGNSLPVLSFIPEKSTGLNRVLVAYNAAELSAMNISGISGNVDVQRYSNMGGGYAEPVNVSYDGNTAIVTNPGGDMGYIITDSNSTEYIWIVNYANHVFQLTSVNGAGSQDCGNTVVDVTGSAPAINYYTIDGRPVELSREIKVDYLNLEWDETSESYIQNVQTKTLDHLPSTISLMPPLYCNSIVTVSGDRFLTQWGRGISVESPLIYANGIDAQTVAIQTNMPDDDEQSSNIIKSDTQGMGGSAPVDVEFKAYTTDAVIHNEWQIASDQMFEYIDYRFNEQNLDYTFNDEGTYYVRYVGSNADGSCEVFGETYTIGVGASELRIPNAFTPNDDGVNDIWKVAYRSLVSFKCSIFDRYGNQLYSFDDPSGGWDGKYKGKTVKPGVYFYVIEAVGADGKKYKKGGDINIIQSKKYSNSGTSPMD